MDIIISNSSDEPIYGQITRQIKDQILSGTLTAGEQLPSIRSLASDLGISAITTKRAYADLESAGFIQTIVGKGSFVAGCNLEILREEHLLRVEKLLGQAYAQARSAGIDAGEFLQMCALVTEGDI